MVKHNVLYRLTGRYMCGQKVTAYHLVGEDGSQAKESRERVILLIGKGVILNMRIQLNEDNEIVLRGKGVNIKKLPIFDENKGQFRDNEASKQASSSGVSIRGSELDNINQMGQYRISKRIMYKNQCLGYELIDYSGNTQNKKRDTVINMAIQRLVSNAVARKTKDSNGKPVIILRGINSELRELPILIVNESGKIVDPKDKVSGLTVRAAYMKSAGVLINSLRDTKTPFRAGQYIVCTPNGEMEIKDRSFIESSYVRDIGGTVATCDDYLDSIEKYSVDIFKGENIRLKRDMIRGWAVFKDNKK